MSFLLNFFTKRNTTLSEYIQAFFSGDDYLPIETRAGAYVNETAALSVTAVYSAVRLISRTLASLPLHVYKKLNPRGKEKATNHPYYRLLHDRPNPRQHSYQWRALSLSHQLLWGAGISEIQRDGRGDPVALWPLPPWKVTPQQVESGDIYYEVSLDDGLKRFIPAHDVLIFTSMAVSDYCWLSPIGVHRETVGQAMALSDFGSRTFGQGTNPAGIITYDGPLNETSQKSLKESLKQYSGLSNSHRLMLLDRGMKFERVGLPPEDAQYLQSRKFSIADIARIYQVPLFLLQEHENSTTWGSGLEEINAGFVSYTLRPDIVQWEQEIQLKLFDDDTEHFCEFLVDGLLRGKLLDRYQAHKIGKDGGWLSANDIRDIENMNDIGPQGDKYMEPLNMKDAKDLGNNKIDDDMGDIDDKEK